MAGPVHPGVAGPPPTPDIPVCHPPAVVPEAGKTVLPGRPPGFGAGPRPGRGLAGGAGSGRGHWPAGP